MQTLGTSDTVATQAAQRPTHVARPLWFLPVIGAASPFWLIAAGFTAALAFASTAHDRVPVGSGVAVAVLAVAAVVDVYEQRLPDIIVGAAGLAFAIGIGIESALRQTDPPLAGVAAGIASFAGPLFVLHLVSPMSMGFGDVKAAIVLGAATGLVDWQLALAGLALAAGFTAALGVATGTPTVAFGPGLVAATAIVLAAHPIFLADTGHPLDGHTGPRHVNAGNTDTGHAHTNHTDTHDVSTRRINTGHTDAHHINTRDTNAGNTDPHHIDRRHIRSGHADTSHADTSRAPTGSSESDHPTVVPVGAATRIDGIDRP